MLNRLKEIKDELKELKNDLREQKEFLFELKSKEIKKYRKQRAELIAQLDKIHGSSQTISDLSSTMKDFLLKDDEATSKND